MPLLLDLSTLYVTVGTVRCYIRHKGGDATRCGQAVGPPHGRARGRGAEGSGEKACGGQDMPSQGATAGSETGREGGEELYRLTPSVTEGKRAAKAGGAACRARSA